LLKKNLPNKKKSLKQSPNVCKGNHQEEEEEEVEEVKGMKKLIIIRQVFLL